jgi:uncharacterized protein (DUF433 family)
MTHEELLDLIAVDADICHGKARIAGTRIPVTVILDNIAAGLDEDAIVEAYPSLTPLAVRAAARYGSLLAAEEVFAFGRTGS